MISTEEKMARIHSITGSYESASKKKRVVKGNSFGKVLGLCGALMLVAMASITVVAAQRILTVSTGSSYDNKNLNAYSSEMPRGTILEAGDELKFVAVGDAKMYMATKVSEQEVSDCAYWSYSGYGEGFTDVANAYGSNRSSISVTIPDEKPYYMVVGSLANAYSDYNSNIIIISGINVNLTYDPNGGNGSSLTESGNGDMTVKSNPYTREGYDFVGWDTDKTASSASYEPGNVIKPTDSIVKSKFSVSFEEVPHDYEHHYCDLMFSTNNRANITLYAVWRKNSSAVNTTVNEENAEKIDPNQINAKKVKLTAGKKSIKVTWKKFKKKEQKLIKGFEIRYSTDKNFKTDVKKVTVGKAKAASKKIGKLSSKKRYYVEIRTYTIKDGEKVYSLWTKPKKVKVK